MPVLIIGLTDLAQEARTWQNAMRPKGTTPGAHRVSVRLLLLSPNVYFPITSAFPSALVMPIATRPWALIASSKSSMRN